MSIPLRIFGCYTIYFRNPSSIIKADPVRMPFIEMVSMAVDWDPHIFMGCIRRSGSICYHDLWYLVLSILHPSRYSHRILGATGGSSQTTKVQNLPLGVMGVPFRLTVNDLSYILRISNIYTPIWSWSIRYRLRLLDD